MNLKQFQFYEIRIQEFADKLNENFLIDSKKLNAIYYHSKEAVSFADKEKLHGKSIHEGERFGNDWENAWFHFTADLPDEWIGKCIAVRLNLGSEIMIVDKNGCPIYGLTHTSIFSLNYTKEYFKLVENAAPGDKIDFWCECAAHNLLGTENMGSSTLSNSICGYCKTMEVGIFDEDLWQLYADFRIIHSLFKSYDPKSARAVQLLTSLNKAVNIYADNRQNAAAARQPLQKELNCRAVDSEISTTAIGHAHIDVGWLWPVKESIRKAARTFASQLELLNKYPDYIFGASQPQLYAFVRDKYPELYEKIKKAVADGRWELQGGMWVEADCNIISGESMVRQFLYGKNFFMDEFGIEVKNLWLPDVFGYSANLPQIIKKSGCDYFLTQKLSWNQFNKMPYNTFIWSGIDNSSVITHFPPEDTYNSNLLPDELIYAKNNFNENYFLPEYLTLTGIGDGGGGPSERYLENARRCQNLEGVPKVKFGMAKDYFERISKYADQLPHWSNELYLEMHRGTLTSQSRTKRNNRKLEQKFAAAEFLCSCIPLSEYPSAEFDKIWKMLLTNQFHDIIPGSSIREVYEVAEKEYAEIHKSLDNIIKNAWSANAESSENHLTLMNSLSYEYDVPVELPESWFDYEVYDEHGNLLNTQKEGNKYWLFANLAPQSFTVLTRGKKYSLPDSAICNPDELSLENDFIRYEFNADGQMIYAFDKTLNQVLTTSAAGNNLQLYVDDPNKWDAWDVDFTYRERSPQSAKGIVAKKIASGKIRQVLYFELQTGQSLIKQRIILNCNSKKLDFATEVDWHESHKMLRVSFPLNICSNEASCDIQYGYLKRAVHTNTSWEFARFEFAAHRYVDLSDSKNGAALLNDCKYGYHVEMNLLDLNLLRSPKNPDAEADMGTHYFTYSYLPHNGNDLAKVIQSSAVLNREISILKGKSNIKSPIRLISGSGVSLEVLKKAEKSENKVIRIVETAGKYSKAEFMIDAKVLTETNLLEWDKLNSFEINDSKFTVEMKPFEIKTFIF